MPKEKYVVKFDINTDLYLAGYVGGSGYENALWLSVDAQLIEYETLAAAQEEATRINGGTVGTIKP